MAFEAVGRGSLFLLGQAGRAKARPLPSTLAAIGEEPCNER
jgi:hypothetical protein